MKKENLPVRMLMLLTGIFVIAFGVALSIRSDLGTTPVSSVPYVFNLIFPTISVGEFTVLLNLLFVVLQRTGIFVEIRNIIHPAARDPFGAFLFIIF